MIAGDLEYVMTSLHHLFLKDTDRERSRVISIFQRYAGSEEKKENIITLFEEEMDKFLSAKESETLQQIRLQTVHQPIFQKSKIDVLRRFSIYCSRLKKDLYQLRTARKSGKEIATTLESIKDLEPGTPLEEEIQLIQWQWDKLEELMIGHYTDFEAVILFKLKLCVLLRWWSFDEQKGFERFLNLTEPGHGR